MLAQEARARYSRDRHLLGVDVQALCNTTRYGAFASRILRQPCSEPPMTRFRSQVLLLRRPPPRMASSTPTLPSECRAQPRQFPRPTSRPARVGRRERATVRTGSSCRHVCTVSPVPVSRSTAVPLSSRHPEPVNARRPSDKMATAYPRPSCRQVCSAEHGPASPTGPDSSASSGLGRFSASSAGVASSPDKPGSAPDEDVRCFRNRLRGFRDRLRCGTMCPEEARQRVVYWDAHARHTNTRRLRRALFGGGSLNPAATRLSGHPAAPQGWTGSLAGS